IGTVTDLSITTYASRLTPLLKAFKKAGLDRINISLDSIYSDRFERVTLTGFYHEVFHTVFNTLEAGFPVKLNMVTLRGLTEKEIIDFVSLADKYPLEVRFLEFMPLCGTGWKKEEFLPIKDVRSIVMEHFDLTEIPREGHAAQSFSIRNGSGRVGFIASLTESFCRDCSRIRLSCDGRILPCLFSDRQVSVKELLQQKAPDEDIMNVIQEAAKIKPAGNQFRDRPFEMTHDSEPVYAKAPYIRKIGG
ncbi:radical SAM protein, partial [PVC group bacterium]|nr:radical SAM protein [PVC group bacterium]